MGIRELLNSVPGNSRQHQEERPSPQLPGKRTKKYNEKEQIISDLTTQLQKDTAASASIADQRKLYERIFITTAQLKDNKDNNNENIETRMFKDRQDINTYNKGISQRQLWKKTAKKDLDYSHGKQFFSFVTKNGLTQHIASLHLKPDNILNLCFTNTDIMRDVKVGDLFSDHKLFHVTLSVKNRTKKNQIAENIDGFSQELSRNIVLKSGHNTLVTFTDASKEATACCTYVVNEIGFKDEHPKDIDHLESSSTRGLICRKVIILTDSSIALDCLKSDPGKKKTGVFVTNRLKSIREAVWEMEEDNITVTFGHVPTNLNPADHEMRTVKINLTINQKFFSLSNSDVENQISTILFASPR
ncbi:hypothetical protein CRE_08126 [Caenorhabditis remanei]|uniref:Uncharacterized protein n=1 Tax=Caenorhabditis remanei TaxID=31234 RepID=E3M3J2_CAERE|nr:hypothetical protein CRE_08126 [Caenorhabditis remanei]